jgi:chaperonin GroES
MNVKPLSDRILIRRMEEGEVKRGGIIIPDTAKEKPQQAEVIAVGPGRFEDGKRIPPDVKKGDKVLIGRYGGTEIKLEGDDFLIISETEILAIID